MAREKRFPKLSAEQAHAALRWLHALVKVTRKDIQNGIGHRDRLVHEIKDRLEQLGGKRPPYLRGPWTLVSTPARRRRRRASAEAQAAWGKARGRYLDAVRRLTAANRSEVKAIKEKGGLKAAIREAKKLAE